MHCKQILNGEMYTNRARKIHFVLKYYLLSLGIGFTFFSDHTFFVQSTRTIIFKYIAQSQWEHLNALPKPGVPSIIVSFLLDTITCIKKIQFIRCKKYTIIRHCSKMIPPILNIHIIPGLNTNNVQIKITIKYYISSNVYW